MSSWANSKPVTKQCWELVKTNRYFIGFPLIAFGIGVVIVIVLGGAGGALMVADNGQGGIWWVGLILLIAMLLMLGIVTQFCMGALVSAADEELHGRDSSLGAGFSAAAKRFGPIALWAAINTTFSLIMSYIQDKGGAAGTIASVIGGVAWNLITFFVLPFIVLEGTGPVTAIKDSGKLFKKRWGMRLSGGVRIGGLIVLVGVLPALLAIVGGIVLSLGTLPAVGLPLMFVGLIVFFGAQLLLSTLRGVFSVALYRYAGSDETLGGFETSQLQAAVRIKG